MTTSRSDKTNQINVTAAEKARAALMTRLARLDSVPVRPPQSLQPTPEAAKSRARRLRKKRLLLQRSKRGASSPTQSALRSGGF